MSNGRRLRQPGPAAESRAGTYPMMPPGTCRESSWVLAACYDELEYVEGILVMIIPTTDGQVVRGHIEHAWNVTPDGTVIDSTLSLIHRQGAQAGRLTLQYLPGDSGESQWVNDPDGSARITALARRRTSGLSRDARHKVVAAIGQSFISDLDDWPMPETPAAFAR